MLMVLGRALTEELELSAEKFGESQNAIGSRQVILFLGQHFEQ
jgi:hypothetical protein